MVAKYAKKNIFGNSDTIDKINDKDYDIFFYTIGWESRFAEILNHLDSSFHSQKNYVLSFITKENAYDVNNYNFDRKNDLAPRYKPGYDIDQKNKFIEKLKAHIGSEPEKKEYEYSDFKKFNEEINDLIYSQLEIKRRPLKIGFEISSCPRYYFLYVLGLCISKNYTSKLSFFYSEGKYSESTTESDFFNSYGVETEIIPYSGSITREGKVIFVFSLGFESHFIIDEITKYEPHHVIFLCANPGYASQYEEKVKDEIKRIVNFCELPKSMYTKKDVAAGDAIRAWEQLEGNLIALEDNVNINIKDSYFVHYVTGTKPHCLAMLLNGLVNNNMVVKYRIAKKYNEREVEPNGTFWRYDITNLRVIE